MAQPPASSLGLGLADHMLSEQQLTARTFQEPRACLGFTEIYSQWEGAGVWSIHNRAALCQVIQMGEKGPGPQRAHHLDQED